MPSGTDILTKEERLFDLANAVQSCTLCPRLCNRKKVLSEKNGNVNTKVLFIAEAPGRLGADKTGIPLYGDKTGENFERLLECVCWNREDIFITNAVLCNPRQENGNNSTPSKQELLNCSNYLEMTIQLVEPPIIVTLGSLALSSLKFIQKHDYNISEHVGRFHPWAGRIIFPLYHPGPRASVHRSIEKQIFDFNNLAKCINPKEGIINKSLVNRIKIGSKLPADFKTPLSNLILTLVDHIGSLSYFKLTKLLYLIELEALKRVGKTISGEIFLRQKDGPWPPKLKNIISELKGCEVTVEFIRGMPIVNRGPSPRYEPELDDKSLEIVAGILERFGHLSNSEIKRKVYLTKPMRYFLSEEKKGRNLINKPVIYKDMVAPETLKG